MTPSLSISMSSGAKVDGAPILLWINLWILSKLTQLALTRKRGFVSDGRALAAKDDGVSEVDDTRL